MKSIFIFIMSFIEAYSLNVLYGLNLKEIGWISGLGFLIMFSSINTLLIYVGEGKKKEK